jgi:hypothetical protein
MEVMYGLAIKAESCIDVTVYVVLVKKSKTVEGIT